MFLSVDDKICLLQPPLCLSWLLEGGIGQRQPQYRVYTLRVSGR